MPHLNVEIKARCSFPEKIRNYLGDQKAEFKGVDEQTDTYFNVSSGRLKLRQGVIENNLIFYKRENIAGPKSSHFQLVKVEDSEELKFVLEQACGIKMIVRKRREIYYIGNVKFHIDEVNGLGSFVEIEAGNLITDKTKDELLEQCNFYIKEFGLEQEDLVSESYSDMMEKSS